MMVAWALIALFLVVTVAGWPILRWLSGRPEWEPYGGAALALGLAPLLCFAAALLTFAIAYGAPLLPLLGGVGVGVLVSLLVGLLGAQR